MVDEEFFLYKIYALFHDPPHKMTVLMGKIGYDYFKEHSVCKKEREYSAGEKENNNTQGDKKNSTRDHEEEAKLMLY